MSLLSIVKSASLRILASNPTVAASSADPKVLQLVECVNEEGQELSSRHSWQALRHEATFNTVAAESQGDIRVICGQDFNFIVNETMWNRSQRRPVFGPKSPAEWQQLKAQFMQGPWIQYMLRGNQLLFLPVPSAGFAIYFEWISKYWCTASDLVTGQTSMLVDTDVGTLDERLLTLGAIWRFKQKNNLDYGEDQDTYEKAVQDAIGRDGSKGRLNLAGAQSDIYPGVVVPAGSWPISGEPST